MTDRKVFSGSLRHVSLADVFQLLGGNSFTGILNLRSQYSEYIGVIYFMKGNPINGYYGDLKGLDAVYAMFGLTDGNYEFYEQALTQIDPIIKKNRMQVVLDALRMLDDGEIKIVGPLPPKKMEMEKEAVKEEVKNEEVEKKESGNNILQSMKGPSEHVCASCGTPFLYFDDTESSIPVQEYCFKCAMKIGNIKDGNSKPKKPDGIIKPDKPLDSAVKASRPIDRAAKVSRPIDSAAKVRKPMDSTVKVKKSIHSASRIDKPVEGTSRVGKPIESTPRVEKTIESATQFDKPVEKDKSKSKSWGTFHYSVMASAALVCILLGIVLYIQLKPSSQKSELVKRDSNFYIKGTKPSTSGQMTENQAAPVSNDTDSSDTFDPASGQMYTGQIAENQAAPVADNTNSLNVQDTTSEQIKTAKVTEKKSVPVSNNAGSSNTRKTTTERVKTAKVTESKSAPVTNNVSSSNTQKLSSGQAATPSVTEKKSTPAPIKKIEEPAKQVLAQQENLVEKNTASETPINEVEEPPVTAAATKEAVKEIMDSTKSAIESTEVAEKTEVAKMTSPAEAIAVEEQVTIKKDPEFPGGKAALAKWIGSHLTYPEAAIETGVEGNVIVEFTIEPDGKVTNVTVVKSLQKWCDDEAVRVIAKMPKWKPGEVNGVKTASKSMLSLRFDLQ